MSLISIDWVMPTEPVKSGAAHGHNRRALDFIVIGAQKAGTTSLWQYLREYPRLLMPSAKEVPFFTGEDPSLKELYGGMRQLFPDAPADALIGKVTPSYMVGGPNVQVGMVAERIAMAFPAVKLIALLRDPIERAVSSYTMAVRREQEERSLDAALDSLLDPAELVNARLRPTDTNTYVMAGEYGRILGAYRRVFSADQLLVAFTGDLDQNPGGVLDEVLEFLGLPTGYRPEGLGFRHFRGGSRKLLDPEAEKLLFRFHREEILPHMSGSSAVHRKAFEFFYTTWNVAPGDRPPSIPTDIRAQLEAHYERDAAGLVALGFDAPWIEQWRASLQSKREGS